MGLSRIVFRLITSESDDNESNNWCTRLNYVKTYVYSSAKGPINSLCSVIGLEALIAHAQ